MEKPQQAPYQIAIIGAGFAGIGLAIRLKMAGYHNFIILERASEIGGTWRENVYPGCACDIPSHLYSFSFSPNPNWSRKYASQPEILAYMQDCIRKHELADKIRLNTEITKLSFQKERGTWRLSSAQGHRMEARVVCAGLGPLNRPNFPEIPGLASFAGKLMHSAQWDHAYDLRGKKVAVIGTGASAIQFVPQVAPKASQLTIYQRTPPWIAPRDDRAFYGWEKFLFRQLDWIRLGYRERLYWFQELLGLGFTGNLRVRKMAQKRAEKHLHKSVQNPELRKKLKPDYTIGCKRVLVSDDYYPALSREHVSLETSGIAEIRPHSILSKNGVEREFDAILLGTGFQVADMAIPIQVQGLEKKDLIRQWQEDGARTFYGISIHNFPNLLFMVGPNTGLGHNSIIHMIESQINYILSYLQHLEKQEPTWYLNLKKESQDRFFEEMKAEMPKTVWMQGCSSWYLNQEGENTTLWPKLTVSYRKETQSAQLEDYEVLQAEALAKTEALSPKN